MDNSLEIFTDYISKNYNLNDMLVSEKYMHTIRVHTLMIYLGQMLNLPSKDILLASKIGLFHDLGRFHELERNKSLNKKFNNLSFDHGAWSNKMLFNDGLISLFHVKPSDYLLIRKAIYNHGKKDLTTNLNDRELLFVKMIRDMDKLDILFIRSSKKHLTLDSNYNQKVYDAFMNDQTIDIKDLKTDSDRVLFYLSFIKDLYFDESYFFAIDNGYLLQFLQIVDIDDIELFSDIMEKVKERMDKNVRQKVRS